MIELYLWTGEGASDRNMHILTCLSTLISLVGLPTFVAGDFNMTLSELALSGWLGSSTLVPLTSDARPTCFSRTPRALDHVLASTRLGGFGIQVATVDSIRVTHWSLQFQIPVQPLALKGMMQHLCKDLPITSDDHMTEGRFEFDSDLWQQCLVEACLSCQIAPPTGFENQVVFRWFAAVPYDELLAVVSLAAELYTVKLTCGPNASTKGYTGRGTALSLRYKSLVKPTGDDAVSLSPLLSLWMRVYTLLMALHRSTRSGTGLSSFLLQRLATEAALLPQHYLAIEQGLPLDEFTELLLWPPRHLERLDHALWHAKVVRDLKTAEAKAQAAAAFKLKLEQDLANNASMAHKIVSGKSASQPVVCPATRLEDLPVQAAKWESIWAGSHSQQPTFGSFEAEISERNTARLFHHQPVAGIGLHGFVSCCKAYPAKKSRWG